MTASERLRALDGAMSDPALHVSPYAVIGEHGKWAELALPYFALRNALPLIADVVEAAEREHPEPHNYWEILDDEGNETTVCPTCAALTALKEALDAS